MRAAEAFAVMQVAIVIDMLVGVLVGMVVGMVVPMLVVMMAVLMGMFVGLFLPLDLHIVLAASTNRTHGFLPGTVVLSMRPHCAPFDHIHATAKTLYFKK